ncbi:DNase I-like protein [Rhizopogon salebrosus TDB-379]|nr:DNase I-like protein [Rhizopogon salebrosus TDB-379]
MKGRASLPLGPSQISKWATINRMMRENKIDILCVQETHLTLEHITQIEALFARRLLVLNSSDPDRPGCSAGVAFILNKETINVTSAKMNVLIPGRAITLNLKWHNDINLNLINVYAPNNTTEHPDFWNSICTKWTTTNQTSPDFMLGDFNLTEDAIDRAPARTDNETAINALRDLRSTLNLQDLWRHTYPQERLFTFTSNTNMLSRLDRIYASALHAHHLSDWDSLPCLVPTDHKLVRVRFAPSDLPHIGPGRWSWPTGLLTDPTLIQTLINMGMQTQREIENLTARTETSNPQTLWASLKTSMSNETKKVTKSHLARINTRINQLQKDLKKTSNRGNIDASDDQRLHCVMLEKELDHLIKKRYKNSHLKAQAQWATKGETIRIPPEPPTNVRCRH